MPTIKMDMNPDDENLDTISDRVAPLSDEDRQKMREKYDREADEISDEIDLENNSDDEKQAIPEPKLKRDSMKQEDIFAIEKSTTQEVSEATKPKSNLAKHTSGLTKKGLPRKKRPPMTEEQKEKLKKAREKALQVRRQKAKEKLEMKELDTKEKELKKKQKYKKVKELEEEIIEDKPKTNNNNNNNFVAFSKKDLEEAQLEAIIKYDTIRKTRKKEKQEKIKKEQEEEVLKQTLRRAIAPQQPTNPFYACY